jgi:hypothetical protein
MVPNSKKNVKRTFPPYYWTKGFPGVYHCCMRHRKITGIFLFLAAVLAPPFSAFAQTGAEDAVFAPFVSRLSAEIKNNLIRLSWQDSPDVRGTVYIFRSSQPLETGQIPANIRPLEAPYGTQSYIDETEETGTLHYFVAASDDQGRRYDIVIPYSNAIAVRAGGAPEGSPPDREDFDAPAPAAPALSGLEAVVEGEGVIISFQAGDGRKNTVLYRSVQPLRNTSDLLQALIVQSGITSPFTDYPVPGIPYYYAIVPEDELIRGNVGLFPGKNVTTQPVEIPSTSGRAGLPGPDAPIRSMPLPLISVYNAVPGSDRYSETPAATPMDPGAAKALDSIPRAKPNPPPQKKPRVFSRDLEPPAGGEEAPLRTIVRESFAKRDWYAARNELIHYLSLPRSAPSEARARFYLAQSYYFSGDNRGALIEFLMVQSQYPDEAQEWINAVLAAMVQ